MADTPEFEYRIMVRGWCGWPHELMYTSNRNYHGIWFTLSGVKTAMAHGKKQARRRGDEAEFRIEVRPVESGWETLDE